MTNKHMAVAKEIHDAIHNKKYTTRQTAKLIAEHVEEETKRLRNHLENILSEAQNAPSLDEFHYISREAEEALNKGED